MKSIMYIIAILADSLFMANTKYDAFASDSAAHAIMNIPFDFCCNIRWESACGFEATYPNDANYSFGEDGCWASGYTFRKITSNILTSICSPSGGRSLIPFSVK
jgi:hypothetical protein